MSVSVHHSADYFLRRGRAKGAKRRLVLQVPAIHAFRIRPMVGGYVYIVTNRPNGTLYVGVTSDLIRRVYQHREGAVEGFTKRHGLMRLVWFEQYDDIRTAIQRERTMKHWPRAWKARLVNGRNPNWSDLYEELL